MNLNLSITKAGESELGQSIDLWKFGTKEKTDILVVAGVHGDETEGVLVAEGLIRKTIENKQVTDSLYGKGLAFILNLNPDGRIFNQRANKNNVDLNRNLPTSNWRSEATTERYKPGPNPESEKETQVFISAIRTLKPKLIVSLHSFTKTLLLYPTNENSMKYLPAVDKLSKQISLPVVQEMDYTVFGGLSRYGIENNIATLTIELPKGQDRNSIIDHYLPAIWGFLNEIN
ncbi:MAG: DUF2817 domain-containing protein [Neobacillus sp.]